MAATTHLKELISQGQNNSLKTAYVGLWVTSPTVTGSLVGEVSAGEYARILVPWGSALQLTTDTIINWAEAVSDWGFISHVVLCDSLTGVNVLAYQQLSSLAEIATGATASIPVGDLSLVTT